MYPLYFYICLIASISCIVILTLVAIFPIKLPIVPKSSPISQTPVHHRKARSPTPPTQPISYWNSWDNDEDDL